MKARILFNELEIIVDKSVIESDVFDIDFNGEMMVRFKRLDDEVVIPINAMDGWGDNCFDKIRYKLPLIEIKIT